MEIREITKEGLQAALNLIWEVFLEFEAPEYSQEGIDEFKRFLDEQTEEFSLEMYGAFEKDELLGVIVTTSVGSHIALFFVRPEHHGRHIGRKLFEHIIPLCGSEFITVNSSPYAVKIYRKLGFADTASEQLTNGIRYVPMKYTVERNNG
jgi:GNAT superfamily N-acetyltransferase